MSNQKNKPVKDNFKLYSIKSYKLSLTFEGPLISQAAGTMSLGLDAAMQRNTNNIPVINGSLIRGNIRHALTKFQQITNDADLKKQIIDWFGDESANGSYTPIRANADFDFHWVLQKSENYNKEAQRIRIKIDDNGVAENTALQVIEDCFPTGCNNPVFTGVITLRYKDKENEQFLRWIIKALEYIPAMGSFKGVGYGKLVSSNLNKISPSEALNNTIDKNSTRFSITLRLDRPLCIGTPINPESNIITSQETITGNILKGIIARRYQNDSERLARDFCFDDLIFRHASPTKSDNAKRLKPIPASMVIQEEFIDKESHKTTYKLDDLAELTKQQLKEYNPDIAPKFQVDWKNKDTNRFYPKRKTPDRTITLRTAINDNGISEESKLFSIESIDPTGFIWIGEIDLCKLTDKNKQQEVSVRLQKLLQGGLTGIGKTKAHAQVELTHLDSHPELDEEAESFIVCLATSARLLPPNLNVEGTNSSKALKELYKCYWENYVHSELELQTYFAQQSLESTYYHTQINKINRQYYPEWLTKAGSVFIVKANSAEAKEALQKCLPTGLPAHKEVDGSEATWRTTPYIPENGYGEITIKPQTGEPHV